MKELIRMMAIVAICIPVITGCSEKKSQTTEEATTQTEIQIDALDLDRVNAYAKTTDAEMTSDDYDFLLDQLEIICKEFDGKSKEDVQKLMQNMDENEMSALLVIGMAIPAAEKSGKLSTSQLERFKSLEQKYNPE